MYRIKLDNISDLGLISQMQYAEVLGLTNVYINYIFRGKKTIRLLVAKGIISLAYNISVRNSEQMQELLEKHFTKEN